MTRPSLDNIVTRVRDRLLYYRKAGSVRSALPLFVLDSLDKLRIRIAPYHIVLEGATERPPPPRGIEVESYNFRFLGKEDLVSLVGIPGRTISAENMLQRLRDGGMCYAAITGNDIVSFVWCNLRNCTLTSYQLFALQDNEAYLFDAFTLPNIVVAGLLPISVISFTESSKNTAAQHCIASP